MAEAGVRLPPALAAQRASAAGCTPRVAGGGGMPVYRGARHSLVADVIQRFTLDDRPPSAASPEPAAAGAATAAAAASRGTRPRHGISQGPAVAAAASAAAAASTTASAGARRSTSKRSSASSVDSAAASPVLARTAAASLGLSVGKTYSVSSEGASSSLSGQQEQPGKKAASSDRPGLVLQRNSQGWVRGIVDPSQQQQQRLSRDSGEGGGLRFVSRYLAEDGHAAQNRAAAGPSPDADASCCLEDELLADVSSSAGALKPQTPEAPEAEERPDLRRAASGSSSSDGSTRCTTSDEEGGGREQAEPHDEGQGGGQGPSDAESLGGAAAAPGGAGGGPPSDDDGSGGGGGDDDGDDGSSPAPQVSGLGSLLSLLGTNGDGQPGATADEEGPGQGEGQKTRCSRWALLRILAKFARLSADLHRSGSSPAEGSDDTIEEETEEPVASPRPRAKSRQQASSGNSGKPWTDEELRFIFDSSATRRSRSGRPMMPLVDWRSFCAVMDGLGAIPVAKGRHGCDRVDCLYGDRLKIQIDLSVRYGMGHGEASKGLVFETFRACFHQMYYPGVRLSELEASLGLKADEEDGDDEDAAGNA